VFTDLLKDWDTQWRIAGFVCESRTEESKVRQGGFVTHWVVYSEEFGRLAQGMETGYSAKYCYDTSCIKANDVAQNAHRIIDQAVSAARRAA
jgi:hypothetical protein